MKFTKMQGCGNDYVYINCFEEKVEKPTELAIKLSDRHFGIGGDGVILIRPSEIADCMMDMYNLDGSRGKMCGNGIRCVGKYAYDHGIATKPEIKVETLSGIKTLKFYTGNDGKVESVSVDMGSAIFDPKEIPLNVKYIEILANNNCTDAVTSYNHYKSGASNCIKNFPLTINGKELRFTFVSMGNPHAVTFIDDTASLRIEDYGPEAEVHEIFPEKANIEFIQIVDRKHINMRVWERGSGETFACGTGACAAVVACVENGLTDTEVEVKLLGGILKINYNPDTKEVIMNGPAVEVFSGDINI